MLTNGFNREELAACVPGATLKCTTSVVMYGTTNIAFTTGQGYKIESVSDPLMVVIDNFEKNHIIDGLFFRKHFALDNSRNAVHLSEAGLHAGRRLCGAARDDGNRSVHAIYAPLQRPEFRATVCQACLYVWAVEAYDEGESVPDYIAEVRQKHTTDLACTARTAAPAHRSVLVQR
jgi:hypothetical protein